MWGPDVTSARRNSHRRIWKMNGAREFSGARSHRSHVLFLPSSNACTPPLSRFFWRLVIPPYVNFLFSQKGKNKRKYYGQDSKDISPSFAPPLFSRSLIFASSLVVVALRSLPFYLGPSFIGRLNPRKWFILFPGSGFLLRSCRSRLDRVSMVLVGSPTSRFFSGRPHFPVLFFLHPSLSYLSVLILTVSLFDSFRVC